MKATHSKELCFFVSDLHGKKSRYERLFAAMQSEQPALVLLGGDLLPHPRVSEHDDFLLEYVAAELQKLKAVLGSAYPVIGLILGNDDARCFEPSAEKGEEHGLWSYLHMRSQKFGEYEVYGYSYVPPTPFLLKDWERYDVSRYVDPGCIPPTEGKRTVEIDPDEAEYSTIQKDLEKMTEGKDLGRSIFLFHSPPYQSKLDRAALDGMKFDHVPLDVHVGSIAIQRFIAERQPYITLHGHIHESSSITGDWQEHIGNTYSFSAAWHCQELAVVKFFLDEPSTAVRELL
jgi:Icc-related predicted phosphoesterase